MSGERLGVKMYAEIFEKALETAVLIAKEHGVGVNMIDETLSGGFVTGEDGIDRMPVWRFTLVVDEEVPEGYLGHEVIHPIEEPTE